MSKGFYNVPFQGNEEVLSYAPGSAEREELQAKYKEMYKDYHTKPRQNRRREAADYIRNTSFLHNRNYRMIYDDIGEDIYKIIKEDECEWIINKYITLLIEPRRKNQLTQYITNFCTSKNEGQCYRKYIFTAVNREKRDGYKFLEKINKLTFL